MPSPRSNVPAAPPPYSSLRLPPVALAVTAAMAMAACGKKPEEKAAAQQQMPAVPAGEVAATPAAVGLGTELPGRVEARRVAQIPPRRAGIVQQRLFPERSDVKAGQGRDLM